MPDWLPATDIPAISALTAYLATITFFATTPTALASATATPSATSATTVAAHAAAAATAADHSGRGRAPCDHVHDNS